LFIFTGGSYKLEVVLYKRPRWINYGKIHNEGQYKQSTVVVNKCCFHVSIYKPKNELNETIILK